MDGTKAPARLSALDFDGKKRSRGLTPCSSTSTTAAEVRPAQVLTLQIPDDIVKTAVRVLSEVQR